MDCPQHNANQGDGDEDGRKRLDLATRRMNSRATSGSWDGIACFLLLAFALSWAAWIGLRRLGVPFGIRAAVGMFGPLLAVVVLRLLRREGWSGLGLRLSRTGRPDAAYLYAYLLIPLLLASGLLLGLVLGRQHWALSQNYAALLASRPPPGANAPSPPLPATVAIQLAAALTIAPLINAVFALGEELGWRGFLFPQLTPLGTLTAALLVGIVWGLWHAPLIILDGYEYPGHPWIGPFFFCLYTVPLSVILCWLRQRSDSVFPCAIAHGAVNAQAGFVALALSRTSPLLGPPIGVLGIIPMLAAAAWLVATRRLSIAPPR